MKTIALSALCATTLVLPCFCSAQNVPEPMNWETGDKLTFNWTRNGKSIAMVEEVVGTSDSAIGIRYTAGDRSYDAALVPGTFLYPKGICLANGQACDFAPAFKWIEFPLERGRKWSGVSTVTGETFIAEVTYEHSVEKLEKVKVPAGEFEAFRIAQSGKIKARDRQGANPSTGKESGTVWIALVNGKPVPVRTEYRNSYGEKFTRELVTYQMK